MSNPYSPPKAAIADIGEPQLPRRLRVLRALAVAGTLLLGSTPLLIFLWYPPMGARFLLFSTALFALVAVTIMAFASRSAERPMRWSAMLLNGAVAALLGYALLFEDRGATRAFNLLFIVPALLNMVVLEVLRRARARFSSG